MKISIMQPYFFPYIGYFQLIKVVDKFVIYDDVNFIKRGWINRNRILSNHNGLLITLKIEKSSTSRLINEHMIFQDNKNLTETIRRAYSKSTNFVEAFSLIRKIFENSERNLSSFLEFSINEICNYLEIDTEIVVSSKLRKNNNLRGEEKIVEICKVLNANMYINPIGGKDLYSRERFKREGIDLCFLKTKDFKYKQYKEEFIPSLSIIDLMMFNSKDKISKFLDHFELII